MLCASPHKTDNLQFWLTIYGIIPIAECLNYVNDGTNDPHDWMLDGSAVKSGEDITVTCNSGYVQILGLNIRDFCDLAENALVSVCMRKYTMHHKLSHEIMNCSVRNGIRLVRYQNLLAIISTTTKSQKREHIFESA